MVSSWRDRYTSLPRDRIAAVVGDDPRAVRMIEDLQTAAFEDMPATLDLKADKATTFTAGAGLTGGGDLSANRTFDVGAGTGITVAADAVSIDQAFVSELARDTIGAALLSGANILITVNDAADTITIAVTGLAAIATSGSASDLIAGTVPAARMPALTGDVTTVAGAVATTLATVNANVGTFGSATKTVTVIANAKGLITAISEQTVTPAASSITGAGDLTKGDDTNVTLTLGGTATGSLLKAVSITAGWTGTLPVTRGGLGFGTTTQGDILYADGANSLAKLAKNTSATRYLSNTGTSNNPAWAQVNLADGVTGTLPVANGGTGDTGTAWSAYTPTVNAGSGSYTTVSASGRYKQIGKTVFVNIKVTITDNGTAASYFTVSLPVNGNASLSQIIPAREVSVNGFTGAGYIATSSGSALVTKYDGTYLGGTSWVVSLTGVYEAA